MNTSFKLIAYMVYIPVVLLLTWYVAHTLFKNGKIFILDIFHGREDIAQATNKLFEVGFYLLNVGFALVILKINYELISSRGTVEVLSQKIGGFSIYLGLMLFFNMYLFFRGKKVSKERAMLAAALASKESPRV